MASDNDVYRVYQEVLAEPPREVRYVFCFDINLSVCSNSSEHSEYSYRLRIEPYSTKKLRDYLYTSLFSTNLSLSFTVELKGAGSTNRRKLEELERYLGRSLFERERTFAQAIVSAYKNKILGWFKRVEREAGTLPPLLRNLLSILEREEFKIYALFIDKALLLPLGERRILFTFKVNGYYVGNLPEHRSSSYLLFRRFLGPVYTGNAVCSICGGRSNELYYFSPFKKYSYLKLNLLPGFNVENVPRSFPVCKSCLDSMLVALAYVRSELYIKVFDMSCLVLPILKLPKSQRGISSLATKIMRYIDYFLSRYYELHDKNISELIRGISFLRRSLEELGVQLLDVLFLFSGVPSEDKLVSFSVHSLERLLRRKEFIEELLGESLSLRYLWLSERYRSIRIFLRRLLLGDLSIADMKEFLRRAARIIYNGVHRKRLSFFVREVLLLLMAYLLLRYELDGGENLQEFKESSPEKRLMWYLRTLKVDTSGSRGAVLLGALLALLFKRAIGIVDSVAYIFPYVGRLKNLNLKDIRAMFSYVINHYYIRALSAREELRDFFTAVEPLIKLCGEELAKSMGEREYGDDYSFFLALGVALSRSIGHHLRIPERYLNDLSDGYELDLAIEDGLSHELSLKAFQEELEMEEGSDGVDELGRE